ncbi:Uncharacterised protein [Pasteurella multocida subsp. septica]|nr:Uncharacterised protein [Pasteurella multocida subsp. septica]
MFVFFMRLKQGRVINDDEKSAFFQAKQYRVLPDGRVSFSLLVQKKK